MTGLPCACVPQEGGVFQSGACGHQFVSVRSHMLVLFDVVLLVPPGSLYPSKVCGVQKDGIRVEKCRDGVPVLCGHGIDFFHDSH